MTINEELKILKEFLEEIQKEAGRLYDFEDCMPLQETVAENLINCADNSLRYLTNIKVKINQIKDRTDLI